MREYHDFYLKIDVILLCSVSFKRPAYGVYLQIETIFTGLYFLYDDTNEVESIPS